uniref:ATP synthase complex subunit 8 n=1 Tax=Gandalfus yunohana TaxID=585898 RepID=D2CS30_GANYU|nr:ATP synthase F0 subunit 8 [Gandalfus yunohana]ACC62347.1 ATP synthase F0 subunit 8 [Gandalfus yunohana]
MPQMAPLLWFYLYLFFLISLMLFLMMNYFLIPFKKISTPTLTTHKFHKSWKL